MFSQPTDTTNCFIAKKKRFLIKEKIFILKVNDSTFLFENYSTGMGIFWGVYRDTLLKNNNKLNSNNLEIEFLKKQKFKLYSKKSKKKYRYKYEISDISIPEILYTRNMTYREEIKYKIDDKEKSLKFVKKTDDFIIKLNHEEFKNKTKQVLEELGVTIIKK